MQVLSPVEHDGAPAKSVPLQLCASSLSLLHFVLSVRANISCSSLYISLSLYRSLFVCHQSHSHPLFLPRPQGFLKNERDNALLSAIEESRRRVSICPVSDCFSGWRRATDEWQILNPIVCETSSKAPPDSDRTTKPARLYYFFNSVLKDKMQSLDSNHTREWFFVCLIFSFPKSDQRFQHCNAYERFTIKEHLKNYFLVISTCCDLKVLLVWTFRECFWNGFPDVQR